MNILIFIPSFPYSRGGIAQYVINLLNELKNDKTHTYFIYSFDQKNSFYNDFTHINPQKEFFDLFSRLRQKVFQILIKKATRLSMQLDYNFPQPYLSRRLLKKYKIDVVYSPYQISPVCNSPKIVTMHDVQELHFPNFFSPEIRLSRSVLFKKFIDDAAAVVVSYTHIKDDIIRFFKKKQESVFVVPLFLGSPWFKDLEPEKKEVLFSKYNINYDFLIYPAATWEHKNHKKLIDALLYAKTHLKTEIKIICTGIKTEYYSKIEEYILEKEVSEMIFFLGNLPEQELLGLYIYSKGTVIPTKYEAGSFPLIESMLLEKPVICSSVTSLPETIGNSKFTFNPENEKEIAEMLVKLWTEDSFVQECLLNNKKNIGKLSNNKMSKEVLFSAFEFAKQQKHFENNLN